MIPPAPPWTTDCCSSSQQSTPSHHWTATNHSRPREHPQWQSVAVLVLWQEESNASSWWLGVGRIQYGALWPESVEWRYSPLLSREQGGELAGGGGASKWKSSEEREGRRRGGVLFLSCRPSVSFRLSASQRCGLPAGSPRDLASLGLCEHRGGNRWGVWPVQLGPCGGRRGCWCQAAGCDWSSYTWEGRVRTISSIFYFPIKL